MPLNCRVCGRLLSEGKPFCPYCGARVVSQPSGPSVLKIVVALVITLIIGALGALGGCFADFALGYSRSGIPPSLPIIGILLVIAGLWICWMAKYLK